MIPKVEFRYSGIYDQTFLGYMIKLKPKKTKNTLSRQKIWHYISQVEKLWRKEEVKVLKYISKVMGLKWKEKIVPCYVIQHGMCLSDPLTLRIFKEKSYFIDCLTHEMIHQIQSQNVEKFVKWRINVLERKYKKESHITRSHILLHAIHQKIFLDLYNKKRLDRQIKIHVKYPDYGRAWEIVQKEGYENIIKRFRELTR